MVRIGMIRMAAVLACLSAFVAAQESGPLRGLAKLSDAVSRRASSADRSGGNADWVEVKAKSTITLADIKGTGSIRHIWFTINSPSPFHLRELVLRMYWDGETEPSVEVPIGDFFGTGFEYEDVPGGHRGQKYQSWWSLPITVQDRAMNCYFEMPFGNGARITLANDGTQDVSNLYFHVDYQGTGTRRESLTRAAFMRSGDTNRLAPFPSPNPAARMWTAKTTTCSWRPRARASMWEPS
jgi:DUF2961 family protein